MCDADRKHKDEGSTFAFPTAYVTHVSALGTDSPVQSLDRLALPKAVVRLSELFGIVLWLVLIFMCIAGIQYVLCHSVDNALKIIEKALPRQRIIHL